MRNTDTRTVSTRTAAQIVFSTDRPTASQIRRVEERLQRGVLRGVRAGNGCWRTTTGHIAEFLATEALRRQLASGAANTKRAKQQQNSQLEEAYGEVLKDYFLAIIFRRRARRDSKWFSGAVVAGQIVLLLLMVTATATSFQFFLGDSPPEHALIENWIEQDAGGFAVVKWHDAVPDPHGQGIAVRVQYRYFTAGGKPIDTDRVFAIHHNQIVRVDCEL